MDSDVDRGIIGWLKVHHGVISAREAMLLGLGPGAVKGRVKRGEWERVARGVYRLAGAPLTPAAQLRAVVLAAGEGSAASHWSAAWIHGLAELPTTTTVTIPHHRVRTVRNADLVRTRIPFRVMVQNRIPCTDVLRTILDCAAVAGTKQLDDLLDRAVARRAVRIQDVVGAVAKPEFRGHPGRRQLEERLARRGVTGSPSPSVLESRMARLFVDHGLPVPRAEVEWGPQRRYRLDFAYPQLRLAIEVNGWTAHFTPEQQRWDRRRSNTMARAGWTVLHYDWWEVTYEAERVAREIAETYFKLAA
ncbi:MAG TPA: type IV toxin-antitoxin system AbiEi family antitoxin domain-containing protein [Acidimicrobiales bacterium]